jgi:hypothetical protein
MINMKLFCYLLIVGAALLAANCAGTPDAALDFFQSNSGARDALMGTWKAANGDELRFQPDGTGLEQKGRAKRPFSYKVSKNQFVLHYPAGGILIANYAFKDGALVFSYWGALKAEDMDNANGMDSTFHRTKVDFVLDPNANTKLDAAVNRATATIMTSLAADMKIAIMPITSDDTGVSERIRQGLETNFFKNHFTIIDRSQLDAIRRGPRFRQTGDGDASSAVSIGKAAGANVVIVGSVNVSAGERWLYLRALNTQTANVEAVARQPF